MVKSVNNCYPISLTPILCKSMESPITEHIKNHMVTNGFFSTFQYGFIPGRSAPLQLLTVLETWEESIENGYDIDCIYVDFMKAFDTVPHKRLIVKMKCYGIVDPILGWVESFLSNRTQYVSVNGKCWELKAVTSGIPQGSVLGPILFVIYINDLPDVVNKYLYLFADDSKIFNNIKCEKDVEDLQKDLDRMSDWSDRWMLKFHPDKRKHMKIGKKSALSRKYKIKGDIVKNEMEEKDVGVTFDENLIFECHVAEKVKKANSMWGMLPRTFKYMPSSIFVPLYKTMVRSHLDYASSVWSPYTKKHVGMIGVQRRATKQLPGMSEMSYQERLQYLKLPTLAYRRMRGDMIQVYKMISWRYDETVKRILRPMIENIHNTGGNSKRLEKKTLFLHRRNNSME